MEKLRQMEISPVVIVGLIGVGVVAALVAIYLIFMKPAQENSKALAEFNTPAAQAKRDPDQRQIDPNFAAAVQAIKAKEKHQTNQSGFGRAR